MRIIHAHDRQKFVINATRHFLERLLPVLILALCTFGCTQPVSVSAPTRLANRWMIGIEPMPGDPPPVLPFTNRLIADLAGMPNVQVIYAGAKRNSFDFGAWTGNKLLVSPWLGAEGNCMTFTYTIFQEGQQGATFGLIVPPLAAGAEPESACVDRAASQFYQALVLQGL